MVRLAIFSLFAAVTLSSCDRSTPPVLEPQLIVFLDVDENQERLGNTGSPESVPSGHAAQNPSFRSLSAHYLEFAPDKWTPLGQGAVLYKAAETTLGGDTAIDFELSRVVAPGDTFLRIPLAELAIGSYDWVRLSLSYQNYDVEFYYNNQPFSGTLASFVGYNTYIRDLKVRDQTVSVNANKLQGFWGFETLFNVLTGQSPAGATTVPNPLFDTSPIPQGSCVVTGKFATPFQITGLETKDIAVTLSLSVNQSFEWVDGNANGRWDVDTASGENVVNMGLRGLIPIKH